MPAFYSQLVSATTYLFIDLDHLDLYEHELKMNLKKKKEKKEQVKTNKWLCKGKGEQTREKKIDH